MLVKTLELLALFCSFSPAFTGVTSGNVARARSKILRFIFLIKALFILISDWFNEIVLALC